MKKIVTVIALILFAQSAIAAEKVVKCEISNNNKVVLNGKCIFTPDKGGSFSLSGIGGKPLFEGNQDVSITIIGKGVADVRGLTTEGVNSRWGEAKRSGKDKSCWVGEDFKVCAK